MLDSAVRDSSEEMPTPASSVRVRRVSRPGRAIVFVAISVVVAGAAFAAGQRVQSPEGKLAEAASEQIPVFATVEARKVSPGIVAKAAVRQGPVFKIDGTKVSDAALPVVTEMFLKPSDPIENGSLAGTVADRPLFLLDLEIPLYRDLRLKDKGSDVRSLQKSLGAVETGVFDYQTLGLWRALYTKSELTPPGGLGVGTFVSMREIQALPISSYARTVASTAALGSMLGEDVPLVTIFTGPPQVEFRATAIEATKIAVGSETTISNTAGNTTIGKVTEVGPFEAATSGDQPQKAGHRVVVALSGSEMQKYTEGSGVTVSTQAPSAPAKSLPTVAVRDDSGSKYVLVKRKNGEVGRVPITVLESAAGWTSIEAPDMSLGETVQVSP